MTKTMKGSNMKWTEDIKTRFYNEIQAYRALGLRSTKIFEEISNNSETIFQKHLTVELIRKVAYKFDLLHTDPSKNPKNTPTATSSVTTQHQPEITLQQLIKYERMAAAAGFILR